MKKYIGVKLLEAQEMNLSDYNKFNGLIIPEKEDNKKDGYLVKYSDDYSSWLPKEVFESAYFELSETDGSKLNIADIDRMFKIESSESLPDGKSTFVKGNTLTGFVQYDVSSCVDPKNYSKEIGESVSSERMKNKIWYAMGFVLQWAKFGLKH